MKKVLLTAVIGFFLMGCTSISKRTVTTVEKVDIKRYMGLWYEIARYDQSFEAGMVGTTAFYELMPNGTIRVTNSGYVGGLDGKYKEAVGKAYMPNPVQPGKLKVSFFLWFYGDYYIQALDEVNYSYALVGSPSGKYLWFLSRTPQMKREDFDYLKRRAVELGYDLDKLIWVQQQVRK